MQPALSCISAVSSKSSNNNSQLHCVGWVKDAHGLRGDLYVQLFAKSADWLSEATQLYLEKVGSVTGAVAPTAFDIEKATPFKDGLKVKLASFVDRTFAEGWRKAKVYILSELLVAHPGDRVFLDQLQDFTVWDNGVAVGVVRGFGTNGAQDLLRVERVGGGEALVPLVDAYIVRIDFDNLKIMMDLPPGLLTVEEDKS